MTSVTPRVADAPGMTRWHIPGIGTHILSRMGPSSKLQHAPTACQRGSHSAPLGLMLLHLWPILSVSHTGALCVLHSSIVPSAFAPLIRLSLLVNVRASHGGRALLPSIQMASLAGASSTRPGAGSSSAGTALSWRAPDVITFYALHRMPCDSTMCFGVISARPHHRGDATGGRH